jgi:putative GTP pyrophosphokinase
MERKTHIFKKLRGLNASRLHIDQNKNVILYFSEENKLEVHTYDTDESALIAYFGFEKMHPGADIVLVRADAAADIRLAYKNYFSDPGDFIRYIERGCQKLSSRRKRRKRKSK